jgi:hypothetical protein
MVFAGGVFALVGAGVPLDGMVDGLLSAMKGAGESAWLIEDSTLGVVAFFSCSGNDSQ